jgi:hypothetical protein
MRGPQLISQRVTTEIKLLLCNTISECFIVNLTTNFHVLTQKVVVCLIYSSMATETPTKFVCVRLENSTWYGQLYAQEMIKIQSGACWS